jgi:hypothetical protein
MHARYRNSGLAIVLLGATVECGRRLAIGAPMGEEGRPQSEFGPGSFPCSSIEEDAIGCGQATAAQGLELVGSVPSLDTGQNHEPNVGRQQLIRGASTMSFLRRIIASHAGASLDGVFVLTAVPGCACKQFEGPFDRDSRRILGTPIDAPGAYRICV